MTNFSLKIANFTDLGQNITNPSQIITNLSALIVNFSQKIVNFSQNIPKFSYYFSDYIRSLVNFGYFIVMDFGVSYYFIDIKLIHH